jgi:hypothetical protein
MPLCASLRPLVESAPAASHSSISQLASSSNLLLAAHVWRSPEHLLLQMRSESRGSLAPDQAVASARVPKLCVHGGARTRAHRGPSPLVTLMWPLEVGVLQGGWVEQQQHKQEEHASDSSISSSSSRRRARDPQLCARGVCVLAGAHVRAHAAIGASAQPSSPSACSLAAGASSSVSCSIRPGSACGIDGPIGRCAALQRARSGRAAG